MILDIENKIIDDVQTFFANKSVQVNISSEFEDYPEDFPALMIRQIGSAVYTLTQDDDLTPHHWRVTFQLDTFSNKTSGAKSEVKKLMGLADEAMQALKFTLTSSDISTNFDRTITRGTQVYRAIVGEPKTVGNKQIYQMYR